MNHYIRPLRGRIALGISIKFLGTLAELLLPFILTFVLRDVVPRNRLGDIFLWGGIMILCAAIAMYSNLVGNRIGAKNACAVGQQLRRGLFSHILRLSSAQRDRFTVSSLESRITSDTYHVLTFIMRVLRLGVRAPILLVGGCIITFVMDPVLSCVMIGTLPFIFTSVYLIYRRNARIYMQIHAAGDDMIRVVREDVMGIRVIKALSKTEYECNRFDGANRTLVFHEKRVGVTASLAGSLATLLMNCGIVLVVALAALRVSSGLSDAETVLAFMQYFTLISMGVMPLSELFIMYPRYVASCNRIFEVMNTPPDLAVSSTEQLPDKQTSAHIEFESVCFSYLGRRNDLDQISFSLPRGGHLGVIGATGSGKSTLIKLLLRLYDVDSGCIRINGRDVRTIPHDERCAMFGSAMQHDFLYADTIAENIRFGRELTDEQLEQAASIAQVSDFIHSLSDGFEHTLVQRASNLSGGQKQRLLIARAVAAHPDILILDDSSSALDYKTDAALRAALSNNMNGTTMITVAQRVSSVKNCDLILVMDEGRIIGMGDHDHLMATCPVYEEISLSQMGGALVD